MFCFDQRAQVLFLELLAPSKTRGHMKSAKRVGTALSCCAAFAAFMYMPTAGSAEAPVHPLTHAQLNAMAQIMDVTTDGGRYNDALLRSPALAGLKGALRKCLGSSPSDNTPEFTVLALVSADGLPSNVLVAPQNELTTCFAHSLGHATFPSWSGPRPFAMAIRFNAQTGTASLPFRTSGPPVAPPPPPAAPVNRSAGSLR